MPIGNLVPHPLYVSHYRTPLPILQGYIACSLYVWAGWLKKGRRLCNHPGAPYMYEGE